MFQETGEILLPQDLKKAQIYGGKQILFEKEEVDQMKSFDKPGLFIHKENLYVKFPYVIRYNIKCYVVSLVVFCLCVL